MRRRIAVLLADRAGQPILWFDSGSVTRRTLARDVVIVGAVAVLIALGTRS